MTLTASDIYVGAGQFKGGLIRVKGGWLPPGGGVTRVAGCFETSIVPIGMTVRAGSRSAF